MYLNRSDAGRRLAQLLLSYKERAPFVLGLPRGGVVVAHEIALALEAPLDVLVVRKLGAPVNPEFGFGALAPGGVKYLDHHTVSMLRLTAEEIEEIIQEEARELERRMQAYRGERPEPEVAGKTVILVDDGLATGGTARAAVRYIRRGTPARIVLAVPVAPVDTALSMQEEVDDLVCPLRRADFRAIGEWYEDFDQTEDEEVIELLRQNREMIEKQNAGRR